MASQKYENARAKAESFLAGGIRIVFPAFDDLPGLTLRLGIRDTLPNGEKVSEFREKLIEKQLEQEKTRREAATGTDANPAANGATSELQPETLVEVTVHANGAVSATPVVEKSEAEKVAPAADGDEEDEPENDLPENFPHRDKLLAAGHTSLETVAKMTLDDLKDVNGIGGKSAQTILDYGKSA